MLAGGIWDPLHSLFHLFVYPSLLPTPTSTCTQEMSSISTKKLAGLSKNLLFGSVTHILGLNWKR